MSLRLLYRSALRYQYALYARRYSHEQSIVVVELPKVNKEDPNAAKRVFKKGDKAPFAYNDYYEYPEDFKPWGFNYKGDGLLLAWLCTFFFSYFAYQINYLQLVGRSEREPEKVYYYP